MWGTGRGIKITVLSLAGKQAMWVVWKKIKGSISIAIVHASHLLSMLDSDNFFLSFIECYSPVSAV